MCWMLNISTLVARVARYQFRCVALLLEPKRNQHHPELCVCVCVWECYDAATERMCYGTIAKAKIIIISRMRWKESCSRNRETAAWRQVNTEPNKRNGIIGIWLSHINECCILVCSHCMASVLLLFFVHVVRNSVVGYCFEKAMRRHSRVCVLSLNAKHDEWVWESVVVNRPLTLTLWYFNTRHT